MRFGDDVVIFIRSRHIGNAIPIGVGGLGVGDRDSNKAKQSQGETSEYLSYASKEFGAA